MSIAPFLYEMIGRERRVARKAGITMNVNVLRSESTGSIHIKSSDPAEPPAIRFNFLSAAHDRAGVLAAIRKGRELMDPLAVVDSELRVHGIAGLRVADASVMPTLTSGNTNAPTIMIGEKCAEMVLAAAATRKAA